MSSIDRVCSIENCEKKHSAKGLCQMHAWRLKKYGTTDSSVLVKQMKPREEGVNRRGNPLYSVWNGMRQRCSNPNYTFYSYYGGRGIKVCERWQHSFKNFVEDMAPRPEGLTLDRIDVNGDYEPSNCRWATRRTQLINTRKRSNNTSGHPGLSKRGQKWSARFINENLGVYDTFEEAVIAYDKAKGQYLAMLK